MVQIIDDNNFEDVVLKSALPVMVDVYTEWCAPCRAISPYVEQLASQYENKVVICKMDAEKSPEMATQFAIATVPTFLFFKGGELVDKEKTANKANIAEKLNALL